MSAAAPSCRAPFRFLCKHLINDHIHLHIKIHADQSR